MESPGNAQLPANIMLAHHRAPQGHLASAVAAAAATNGVSGGASGRSGGGAAAAAAPGRGSWVEKSPNLAPQKRVNTQKTPQHMPGPGESLPQAAVAHRAEPVTATHLAGTCSSLPRSM